MKPFEFIVLGSGSLDQRRPARPGVYRNPSGYALRRGGEAFVFDLGFGNFRQLQRAGIEPERVSRVFLTHRHPDHVGDLAMLLFFLRYDGRPPRGTLHIYGPRGIRAFVSRLSRAYGPWLGPRGYRLRISEVGEGTVARANGWRVRCRKVPHSTEAVAYRFECAEGAVCYSGDTGYDPGLAEFASGADVFALECTLAGNERDAGHLRVGEALELGRLSGAKRLLLTHLSPASERALKRRKLPRNVRLAADLMKIRL